MVSGDKMKSEKVINEEEKGAGEPRGAQDAPRGGSEQGQTEITQHAECFCMLEGEDISEFIARVVELPGYADWEEVIG